MVAGIPGSGKSAFVEALAAHTNTPTLYFSADQDAWISTTRLIATLTGEDVNTVGLNLSQDPSQYEGVLSRSNIQFCFDSEPSVEDLHEELDAYVETWDEYPQVIVVDTLANIEGSGEKQDDQYIIGKLHSMARTTRACVFLVVHASEANAKDPSRPVPRKELINKVASLPDLIYMVAYAPDEKNFYVAVGKTRDGHDDKRSENPIPIKADFDRMVFGHSASSSWGWGER